jgi:putative redox protein
MAIFSATLTHKDGVSFEATSGSGHTIRIDSPEVTGGGNSGPCPLELLLISVGGCASIVIAAMMRRLRQEVTAYRVDVQGVRVETNPRVFTEITVEHVIEGVNLSAEPIKQALAQASLKICPVVIMMSQATRVIHRYRLVDAESRAELAGTLD